MGMANKLSLGSATYHTAGGDGQRQIPASQVAEMTFKALGPSSLGPMAQGAAEIGESLSGH